MTDTELINWIEANQVTVGPQLDDAWKLMGWYATDTDGRWGTGKCPRQAVENLKAAMEAE